MSYNTYNSPIFVLVTTFNRNELLKSRALVSSSNQTIDFEATSDWDIIANSVEEVADGLDCPLAW